jgi:hypothetical protein
MRSFRIGMSRKSGWGDSETGRRGAGVKALVPHRDREIGRAERSTRRLSRCRRE